MSDHSRQNVRAVTRALAILDSFAGKSLQSLADVTTATGLDKGTTRRLLITLMDNGYIAQDPATHHYKLGRAIRDLAGQVADDHDLRSIARPLLLEISSDLHITAFISVYADGDMICLDRIHDMKGVEVHWWAVGGSLPYNCGGAPKLLLAHQPEAEIERVLAEREPASLTPESITDRAALRARLALIRERGWELAIDDVAVGLTALAVPVRGSDGRVVGAVSIAGLTPQMCEGERPVHLERLLAAAATTEERLCNAGA